MKIEKIEPRHPPAGFPLVHFFETSFGRVRSHLRAGPRPGRRVRRENHEGWGESVAEANPYYSSETTETVLAHHRRSSSRRWSSARASRTRARCSRRWARIRGHNMAKAGVEMASVGSLRAHPRAAAVGRCSAAPAIASPRACRSASRTRSTSCWRRSTRSWRRATSASRSRSSPAGTSTPSSAIRAKFGGIPLQVDANAAYSLDDARPARAARPVQPAADRAAARLRRCDGPCGAAEARSRRRCASTSRSTPCASPATPSTRRPAGSSTSSRAGSAAIGLDRAARPVRGARHPGVARRHARERHRPRAQHPPGQPAELHPARRHRRQQALLPARPHRAGHRHLTPTGPSRCRRAPASA